MEFTVNTALLRDALAWTSNAVPSKPTVPVLAGIKLNVTDGHLTVSAFDFEQSAAATISVNNATDGEALVSGRLLHDIAKAMPGDNLTVTTDGNKVTIQANKSRFQLPTMPLDDYPRLPAPPATTVRVSATALAEATSRVASAAAKDETVPMLTAIHVTIDPAESTITMAATDRYRLASATVTAEAIDGDDTQVLLIPARVLSSYSKLLAKSAVVEIGTGGENLISLTGVKGSDEQTIRYVATSRVLDGNFPAFHSLIPTEFTALVNLPLAPMQETVKRVNLINSHANLPCRLTFANNEVRLVAGTDTDGSSSETIGIDYTADDLTIAFNPSYLLDGLSAVGGIEATLSLVSSTKPALLKNDDGSFIYLLMPVRLP